MSSCKHVGHRQHIFFTNMEKDLPNHKKSLSEMFCGLSRNKCHQLAFEFAIQNNITILDNWKKREKWELARSYHLSLNIDYLCESLKQHQLLLHVERR